MHYTVTPASQFSLIIRNLKKNNSLFSCLCVCKQNKVLITYFAARSSVLLGFHESSNLPGSNALKKGFSYFPPFSPRANFILGYLLKPLYFRADQSKESKRVPPFTLTALLGGGGFVRPHSSIICLLVTNVGLLH